VIFVTCNCFGQTKLVNQELHQSSSRTLVMEQPGSAAAVADGTGSLGRQGKWTWI